MIPIRYIRDWLHGNTVSANDNWIEINALTGAGVNAAAGKSVTASSVGNNLPSLLTDGDITCVSGTSYSQFYITGPVPTQFVVVDLGAIRADIVTITVWHWYSDGRTYHGTKTEVSVDGVNWLPLFDSAVLGEYAETSSGNIMAVSTDYAVLHGLGYFKFALINSNGYFVPSAVPERPTSVVTSNQFLVKTAGGVAYGFDPVVVERDIVLKWPRLRDADVELLVNFFTTAAQGMINNFTVYSDAVSVGYSARFATPRVDIVDNCAGVKEVSLSLRQVLHG